MTLEEKIGCDMPLSTPELMKATGYGRRAMQKIKPPLVCKKIRLSDFWTHLSKWHVETYKATGVVASLGQSSDPLTGEDIQNALRSWNALPGASPNPEESPPRKHE